MTRMVIVGGGWAGCGAAVAAAKAGVEEVHVFEKTDQLLGTGLVGGIFRNNGRWTAAEELMAMGCGEMFEAMDEAARHKMIEFSGGHKHASLYDVMNIESRVKEKLAQFPAIEYHLVSRVTDVLLEEVPAPPQERGGFWHLLGERIPKPSKFKRIKGIQYYEKHGADFGEPHTLMADVFVDATGSVGPQSECARYGNGCVMCIIRCPTFGGRVSLAELCGVPEMIGGASPDKLGAFSGSCKLLKESLSPDVIEVLERSGECVVPIPEQLKDPTKLTRKACQQYATSEYADNIVLLDTGHAKLMTSYFPLETLRQVPGFERARYDDPYSGGIGNSVRYLALSPRDNFLRVGGVENLFCGGEKAGPLVGHTEAVVTGALGGHNAARYAFGLDLIEVPTSLAIGDSIAHVGEQVKTGGLYKKYTYSGAGYFKRMKELGLYVFDVDEIRQRVEAAGMLGAFARNLNPAHHGNLNAAHHLAAVGD